MLFGMVVIVLVVIVVVMVGFFMLIGCMNWCYGVMVIFGCFILFGVVSIVGGI